MNERIRQLKQRAIDWGFEQADSAERQYTLKELHDTVEFKFAELIVRECASLADCPNSFKHRSGAKIRKYFGVE